MKTTDATKVSISSIADPLLLAGVSTRTQIMDQIRKLRPDFKDPSAGIANRFRALVHDGKHPGIVQTDRPAKVKGAVRVPRAAKALSPVDTASRLTKLNEWAARMDIEIAGGFKRLRDYQAKCAAEPKLRRIWPA